MLGKPSSALVRLSLRLGVEGAYSPAATRAVDPKVSEAERADLIKTLGELHRPTSLPSLTALIGSKEPVAVRTTACWRLQRYDSPEIADSILKQYSSMPTSLRTRHATCSSAGRHGPARCSPRSRSPLCPPRI